MLMPRPLRFSRTRYLRHWTIHRAWQLFFHRQKRARQLELQRQFHAMRAACEELRIGAGDGGKLFRKAMMKTGVWTIPEWGGGVPIEYARGMVDWVGGSNPQGDDKTKIWNHEWKRD